MDLPEWIDYDAWLGYVEMRKKIKKPLTERAIKIAITKLDNLRNMGNDPENVLDQSTFNSWQGLFPIRSENGLQTKGSGGNGGRDFAAEREQIQLERIKRVCGISNNVDTNVHRKELKRLRDDSLEGTFTEISEIETG